jgi:colicin import membrane protein
MKATALTVVPRAEADRIAEEKRKADEEAKRQKDRAHRTTVMKAAKEALMLNCELGEGPARDIVTVISNGLIPNVTVNF